MRDESLLHFDPKQDQHALTMSAAALAHLKKMLDARGGGQGLRVAVDKKGCNGYQYEVDYVDEPQAGDHVFAIQEGLLICVDPQSFPKVAGTHIDFQRRGLNDVFVFNNPKQKGACGCGESFNID